TIDRVRVVAPSARTAWLTLGLDDEVIATTLARGHTVIHPWVAQLPHDALRAAHAAGLAVNAWTCDDPARLRELLDWGIDGICTDVPDVALAARRADLPGCAGKHELDRVGDV